MRKGVVIDEVYKCGKSGFKYVIWRKMSEQREKDHLKILFCPECEEEHNFKKQS